RGRAGLGKGVDPFSIINLDMAGEHLYNEPASWEQRGHPSTAARTEAGPGGGVGTLLFPAAVLLGTPDYAATVNDPAPLRVRPDGCGPRSAFCSFAGTARTRDR